MNWHLTQRTEHDCAPKTKLAVKLERDEEREKTGPPSHKAILQYGTACRSERMRALHRRKSSAIRIRTFSESAQRYRYPCVHLLPQHRITSRKNRY